MTHDSETDLETLAANALRHWSDGRTADSTALGGGYSGAIVSKVDIRGDASSSKQIPSGQYVLKTAPYPERPGKEDEYTCHARAADFSTPFSKRHVPKLVSFYDGRLEGINGYSLLVDVAGYSKDFYGGAAGAMNPFFQNVSNLLVRDLLKHWSNKEADEQLATAPELLDQWLGRRLDPTESPSLHQLVSDVFGAQPLAVVGAEALLNPLTLIAELSAASPSPRSRISGLLHADLHGENILIHSRDTSAPYWIIDFGQSQLGPIGFDQSYMEVSQILYNLSERNAAVLVNVLQALEDDSGQPNPIPEAQWLLGCIKSMRAEVQAWIENHHIRRKDDVERQLILSRIAAGLNWANKPISDNKRELALTYAAFAARNFARVREPAIWERISARATEIRSPSASPGADQLWGQFWQLARGFNPSDASYILISGALRDDPNLAALGQLPWSVVIDLDPYSDDSGLLCEAGTVLKSRRGLHVFSGEDRLGDFVGATSWLMSSGWVLKNEHPMSLQEWKFDRLRIIRSLVRDVFTNVGHKPVVVIVLPGASYDADFPELRVELTAEAVEEMTRGKASILVFGKQTLSRWSQPHTRVGLDGYELTRRVSQIFGLQNHPSVFTVPGVDGMHRAVPVEKLRAMQENMEVLHSNILDENAERVADTRGFWAGRPPTWQDLNAGADIPRDLATPLTNVLTQALSVHRNQTIVLMQNPGAGGSTLAHRIAWDLHRRYPVALLTNYSRALADRIQSLFYISETPVLLIAESSKLTEAAREDLYRDLNQRNARCVILYIRKILSKSSAAEEQVQEASESSRLILFDPMKEKEPERFLRAYRNFTTEEYRLSELARITYDESCERYRSPFFYGLITFEREFSKIEEYVGAHIRRLRGKSRDLLEKLALVTIFSNSGLPKTLVNGLMNLSVDSELSIEEMIGDGPARLTVYRDGLRLMHQVIAEEVLQQILNCDADSWAPFLKDICVDFIKEAAFALGADSRVIINLFRELFIERQGVLDQEVEDRRDFSYLIETLDAVDKSHATIVFQTLTDCFPQEAHFWNHRGRYHVYRLRLDDARQAEQYLEEAIRLSPDDAVHHHTYGLVKRSRIRQILNSKSYTTPGELLENVGELYQQAANAFTKARDIKKDDLHGYITHTQMILEIAGTLKKLSGAQSIADLQTGAGQWVNRHITEAVQLLEDASTLYSTLKGEDQYISRCRTELHKLFGNLDEVIRIWELRYATGKANSYGRRALALAYFERGRNSWRRLEESELRTIKTLVEANLALPTRHEEDYRLWFEASRHLPDFDPDDAIARLTTWAQRHPSWRPYYYVYVLRFLKWFEGGTDSTSEMEDALEKCKASYYGRRGLSFLWYGNGPIWCPLVASGDLGKWDDRKNFWPNDNMLKRVRGVTEEKLLRPQSGRIIVQKPVSAFFVPGREFSAHEHENTPVNYFLAFGTEGLRAWDVAIGHDQGVERTTLGSAEPRIELLPSTTLGLNDIQKRQRAGEIRFDRMASFIEDYIAARSEIANGVSLDELKHKIDAVFGLENAFDEMDDNRVTIEGMLNDPSRFVGINSPQGRLYRSTRALRGSDEQKMGRVISYTRTSGRGIVRDQDGLEYRFEREGVHRSSRNRIGAKSVVSFILGGGNSANEASDIRILEGTPASNEVSADDPQALREQVGRRALEIVKGTVGVGDDDGISLRLLSVRLNDSFPGEDILAERLGFPSLTSFLNTTNFLKVTGTFPNLRVIPVGERAPGRLPVRLRPTKEVAKSGSAKDLKSLPFLKPAGQKPKGKSIQQDSARALNAPKPAKQAVEPKDNKRRAISSDDSSSIALPDVSRSILEFLRERSRRNRRVFQTDVAMMLSKAFGASPPLYRRLGYRTFGAMLKSIPNLVFTPHQNNTVVSVDEPPTSTPVVTLADVERFVLLQVDEWWGANKAPLPLTALGKKLSSRFPGDRLIHKRLGLRTLNDLLSRLTTVTVVGEVGAAAVTRVGKTVSSVKTPSA